MKILFLAIALPLMFFMYQLWEMGTSYSHPVQGKVERPVTGYALDAVEIGPVHGWFVPAPAHKACVLLLHGVRSNRNSMIDRAGFLREAGYSSLAIDLQAHGETPGEQITFGYKESESATAATRWLYQEKSCGKVIVIGSSLGGAASLLGEHPLRVDGYILEGVYPSIEQAVENRVRERYGEIGRLLAPLLYLQIPLRTGVDIDTLQPLEAIGKQASAPTLIMNGSKDTHTTVAEAQTLFEKAAEPKMFHIFRNAAHVNLFHFAPDEYKTVVLAFLDKFFAD